MTLFCHSPETAAAIQATGRNDRRLPGIDLSPRIRATADPGALDEATDLVVFAVPSAHLRATVSAVAPTSARPRTCSRSSRASSAARTCG